MDVPWSSSDGRAMTASATAITTSSVPSQQQNHHQLQSKLPPLYPKGGYIYSSSGTLSRSSRKQPPPPPARRTSSISNPNAITLRTLQSAGCSTYEEIKTLKRNSRSMAHLEMCGFESEPIYSNSQTYQNGSGNGGSAGGLVERRHPTPHHLQHHRKSFSQHEPEDRGVDFETARAAVAEKLKSTGASQYADIRTLRRNSRSSLIYSSSCTLSRPTSTKPQYEEQQYEQLPKQHYQQPSQPFRDHLAEMKARFGLTSLPDKPDALNPNLLSSSCPNYNNLTATKANSISNSSNGYFESSEPLYANAASDWPPPANDQAACSEGSITPTNADSGSSSTTTTTSATTTGLCGGYQATNLALGLSTSSKLTAAASEQPQQHYSQPQVVQNGQSRIALQQPFYSLSSQSKSSPTSPLKAPPCQPQCVVPSLVQATLPPAPDRQAAEKQKNAPPLYPKEKSYMYSSTSNIYCSTGTLSRSRNRQPPPPPVRRTSSISNPNAITLRTLKSAGCSNYEEIRTLRRNSRSTTHIDCLSDYDSEPIYSNAIYQNMGSTSTRSSFSRGEDSSSAGDKGGDGGSDTVGFEAAKAALAEFLQAKAVFNTMLSTTTNDNTIGNDSKRNSVADEEPPLPPPPPEAYADPATLNMSQKSQSYNRISNIHRDFLQTLNAKLAVPQEQRMSPRLVKRRSMSVGEHDWDSDSGIATGSTCSAASSISSQSQPHSLRLSLMRLMSHGISSSRLLQSTSSASSSSSGSARRPKSPEATRKTYMYISDI